MNLTEKRIEKNQTNYSPKEKYEQGQSYLMPSQNSYYNDDER